MVDWNDFVLYMFYEDYNYLWLVNVCAWLMLSVFIIYQTRRLEILEKTKQLYTKYALFFACYAISKCFFFFSNYYHDRIETFGINPQEAIILRTGYTINLLAVSFLILGLERDLLNWKGFTASIAFVNTIIIIVAEESIYKTVTMFLQIMYFLIILWGYLLVAIKSTGDIRKYSIRTMFGMGLFFLGIFLDLRVIKDFFIEKNLGDFIFILLPLINLIGTILFYWSIPLNKQKYNL